MIESITFNTAENKLIITLDDETTTEYTDAATYLTEHPDREADCLAMGWTI